MSEPLPKNNRCGKCGEWYHNAHVCGIFSRMMVKDCDATPPPLDVGVLVRVSALMRAIDAYAFDYARDGKLGASRRAVENALSVAFAPLPAPKEPK